jgi:fructuronate reductase
MSELILNEQGLLNREAWEAKGYALPQFDRAAMIEKTLAKPTWLHFGAGNIFKAFQAHAAQKMLDTGLIDTGIIAAERREKKPMTSDNYTIKVTLKSDGSVEKTVIGSIAQTLYLYGNEDKLEAIFENPSLQMVSFTITEKGYSLVDGKGEYLPDVAADLTAKPEDTQSYMGKLTALLYARFKAGAAPIAMVSMDNCSHNGDKLRAAVMTFAQAWGNEDFKAYLTDETKVSFPWSMIDKITPGPDASVAAVLEKDGVAAGTPFVNAEESEYLVIEDKFPNGRPALEKVGIYFTDRETVDKVERMKVCTCLNPLHTSLAVFGCLLGHTHIWAEMQDEELKKLVYTIGYKEGLPVVTDPGIINPKEFIDTVLHVRFLNPFMPDAPQRIATDTSQKLPIRFGETIKAYLASDTLDVKDLKLIPLVFAGWLRYLMAVNDSGEAFEPSPDPLLSTAQPYVAQFKLGDTPSLEELEEKLSGLLGNAAIFGVNLYEAGLADKVCGYYAELISGPGAVRSTLKKYLAEV